MLHEARLDRSGYGTNALADGVVRIAPLDVADDQHIVRPLRMQRIAIRGARFVERDKRRQLVPVDRHLRRVQRADRLPLAGDDRHRLAAEAGDAFGQRRLVGKGRDHPETVASRDVGSRVDPDQARPRRHEGVQVAEAEGCVPVGGAHHQHRQAALRHDVGAVGLLPGHLRHAVEAHRPRADGGPVGKPHVERRVAAPGGGEHCLDDLPIAGAAAQDAAERVAHVLLVG